MTRSLGRIGLGIGALALAATSWGCGASTLPEVRSETERLALARQAMDRHQYLSAIELLKSYVSNNGGSRDVDEAIYRLGQCYVGVREFPSAQVEFERLVRDYPESDSSGSASFRLGEVLFAQTRAQDFDQEYSAKALEQWQNYLASYPGHWLNDEARRRVAATRSRLAAKLADAGHLYLKLGLTGPAGVYFRRIVNEYADTPDVDEARFWLALCEEKQGRPAEAIELLKLLESGHPGGDLARRAASERARLERSPG